MQQCVAILVFSEADFIKMPSVYPNNYPYFRDTL